MISEVETNYIQDLGYEKHVFFLIKICFPYLKKIEADKILIKLSSIVL